MKPHQRPFRRSLVAVLVAAAAGLASFSFSVPAANATEYHYCFGQYLATQSTCTGPRHSLTRNQAITEPYHDVCVYVYNPGIVSSALNCGTQNIVMSWCGCQLVYPAMWSGFNSGTFYGFGTY